MTNRLLSLFIVAAFAASACAQYPYAAIGWIQPQSPTTGNTLTPATFDLSAGLVQGGNLWRHGFSDSTDYGAEYMFWADLGAAFSETLPWSVGYSVNPFLAQDPATGEIWLAYAPFAVVSRGPGSGGVVGVIIWRYIH